MFVVAPVNAVALGNSGALMSTAIQYMLSGDGQVGLIGGSPKGPLHEWECLRYLCIGNVSSILYIMYFCYPNVVTLKPIIAPHG